MHRTNRLTGIASIVGAAMLSTGAARADSTVTGTITSVSSRGTSGTVKVGGTSIAWGSCNPVFTAVDVQTLATAAQNATTVTLSYTLYGGPTLFINCLSGYEVKP